MTPLLSIIIVNWNVEALLRDCLASIYRESAEWADQIEVVVVDSHSSDGSVAMMAAEFPQVISLPQSENVGFPRGNNIGLDVAKGRYLMLLNPDTVVVGGALQTLLNYLEANPAVGMVGPQLRFGDGSIQSSRRRFPTVWIGLFESTWLESAAEGLLARYYMEDLPDDQVAEVDWIVGAAMLLRREVYEQVGGMDADYFMYSEELDWCRRMAAKGWKTVYLPSAQVIHYQGKSSEQASTARHINFNRAKLRYFRKYHGRWASGLIRTVILLNFAAQIGIEAAKGVLGHRRELRRQRVGAYWEVLKSGLPPAGY